MQGQRSRPHPTTLAASSQPVYTLRKLSPTIWAAFPPHEWGAAPPPQKTSFCIFFQLTFCSHISQFAEHKQHLILFSYQQHLARRQSRDRILPSDWLRLRLQPWKIAVRLSERLRPGASTASLWLVERPDADAEADAASAAAASVIRA